MEQETKETAILVRFLVYVMGLHINPVGSAARSSAASAAEYGYEDGVLTADSAAPAARRSGVGVARF